MRVSPRCFAVTGLGYVPPWSVNAGFIAGDRLTLIVDTGANALAASTIHGYATAARPLTPVLVINTEMHFDHIGGNSFFLERGIDVYGHAGIARTQAEFDAEVADFNQRIPDDRRRGLQEADAFFHATTLANPNCPISDETALDLGNCPVQILLTPGHTPTNLSVYVPGDGVLYCGDCLTSRYLPNLAAGGRADWQEWLTSLDRIESLDPSAIVCGHGPVLVHDDVPRALAAVRRELERALAR